MTGCQRGYVVLLADGVGRGKRAVDEMEAANPSMQVMGGIGYTDVFPVERIVRERPAARVHLDGHQRDLTVSQVLMVS